MNNKLVYGIDLGTGFSAIAEWDEKSQTARVISTTDSRTTTPSVVFIANNNKAVVGQEAVNRLGGPNAKNVIAWSKRLIAQDKMFSEDGSFLGDYPVFEGKKLTPITVAALILKKLTALNPNILNNGGPIRVVVTFPAHFSPAARERTRQACKIAGLDVLGMVEEPIAAALQYGAGGRKADRTLLVWDWGCGTYDATLVKFDASGRGTVLAKAGDPKLGGVDCDNAFAYELVQLYKSQKKIKVELTKSDFENDEIDNVEKLRLVNKFRRMANETKHALSSLNELDVVVDDGDVVLHVTRAMFEQCIANLVGDTHAIVRTVLEEAKISDSGVDEVILVGGSSLIPCVQERLECEFPGFKHKVRLSDPMECVAKGAAIWAHILAEGGASEGAGNAENLPTIINKASYSLGVKCVRNSGAGGTENYVSNIIFRGQTTPAAGKDRFSTFYDGQKNVALCIYSSELQDEKISLNDAKEIANPASNLLPFERSVPKDTPLEVELQLDDAGLITVTGKSLVDSGYCRFQLHLNGTLDEKGIAGATRQISEGTTR